MSVSFSARPRTAGQGPRASRPPSSSRSPCWSRPVPDPGRRPSPSTAPSAELPGAPATATPSPAATAQPEPAGTIRLYTSVTQATVDAVVAGYTAAHPGVTVEVFRAPTGELAARIATELRDGRILGDVLWLTDPLSIQAYADQDLLRTWQPTEAAGIDPAYRGETYWGTRFLNMVIVRGSGGRRPGRSTWADLADPGLPRRGRHPRPGFAGSAFGALGYFALSSDGGHGLLRVAQGERRGPGQDPGRGDGRRGRGPLQGRDDPRQLGPDRGDQGFARRTGLADRRRHRDVQPDRRGRRHRERDRRRVAGRVRPVRPRPGRHRRHGLAADPRVRRRSAGRGPAGLPGLDRRRSGARTSCSPAIAPSLVAESSTPATRRLAGGRRPRRGRHRLAGRPAVRRRARTRDRDRWSRRSTGPQATVAIWNSLWTGGLVAAPGGDGRDDGRAR